MLSIRNRIPGKVKLITSDRVVSEITVETAVGDLTSVITTRSVEAMNLQIGDEIYLRVKATEAMIEKGDSTAV